MRYTVVGLALLLASCGGVVTKTDHRAAAPAHNHSVCLLPGELPTTYQYVVVGTIKATKRTYGSVDELGAAVANEARHIGADAVINYSASQRFKGPIPWRLTSPTGVGTGVRLVSGTINCAELRGLSL